MTSPLNGGFGSEWWKPGYLQVTILMGEHIPDGFQGHCTSNRHMVFCMNASQTYQKCMVHTFPNFSERWGFDRYLFRGFIQTSPWWVRFSLVKGWWWRKHEQPCSKIISQSGHITATLWLKRCKKCPGPGLAIPVSHWWCVLLGGIWMWNPHIVSDLSIYITHICQ